MHTIRRKFRASYGKEKSSTCFSWQPTHFVKNGKVSRYSGPNLVRQRAGGLGENHDIGDCVLMKDGHMMMVTKGKMTPIKKDVTLADGTLCKVDGTCSVKGGKQIKLTNGEGIEVAGEKLFRVKGLAPPGSHFQ